MFIALKLTGKGWECCDVEMLGWATLLTAMKMAEDGDQKRLKISMYITMKIDKVDGRHFYRNNY